MLKEIRSDRFRVGSISFREGLNVVLGDESATNSIGKSSLLMVIDFAFGGTSLLEYNTDVVKELGHHEYLLAFQFDGVDYRFRRNTATPDDVSGCDENWNVAELISLDDFRAFLKHSYGDLPDSLSFRSLVGLYSRIWGKSNLDVHHPLHVVPTQKAKDCVENLIKIYGLYGALADLSSTLQDRERRLQAYKDAYRRDIIPRIGQRQFRDNETRIAAISAELSDIKKNLEKYALNISELTNRDVVELKQQKDELLDLRLQIESKLRRIESNLSLNRHIASKNLRSLIDYFPNVHEERLVKVEEFHSGLAKVLKTELLESQRSLRSRLAEISEELGRINATLESKLGALESPAIVVDRVLELSGRLGIAKEENKHFEGAQDVTEERDELRSRLEELTAGVIDQIQRTLNSTMKSIVASVFGADRKSPEIALTDRNYQFEVFEDTGTGTAYTSLIVLDLAIFQTTNLPFLVHDSVLYKNVENMSVAKLLRVYADIRKQSFVAIDEVGKYGKATAEMTAARAVIKLSNSAVLYTKDWRKK